MTEAAVFKGTIGALRTIGGRKVIAVTVEVPIEEQSTVAKIAEHGAWVAVARLAEGEQPKTEERKSRKWHELSVGEQAGIRCNEVVFWEFLEAMNMEAIGGYDKDKAAKALHHYFNVTSRKDIPADAWREFDGEYQLYARNAQ